MTYDGKKYLQFPYRHWGRVGSEYTFRRDLQRQQKRSLDSYRQLCLSLWNIAMAQSGNWAWIAQRNPGALSHESRFYPTPRRSRGRYPARLGSFWDTIEARKYAATVNGAGVVINRPHVKAKQAGGSGRTGRRVFIWDAKSEQMVSVLEN